MNERNLAAVFIDFENFYYSLTNLYGFSYDEVSGTAISIIGNSLDRLQDSLGEFITRQAFADWTELTEPKRELQKMGIRTIDFLSTAHKNSTDIELSLSVQEAVLTRDVLNTIVIFAGDTDYMPVALRTRERGKLLHFVGFRESLSGDLKKILGNGNYSYADTKSLSVDTERPEPLPESDSNDIVELNLYQRKAAEAAIQAFDSYKDQYGSVKLGGFLIDRLAKALPELDHLQRKRTFQDLEDLGLLNIQQKQSYPGGE
ncbi:MAG: NYN domain-containing protein, partial [Candidatus Micrarchaeaceae archaeon]